MMGLLQTIGFPVLCGIAAMIGNGWVINGHVLGNFGNFALGLVGGFISLGLMHLVGWLIR